MKRYYFLIITLFASVAGFAQSWSSIQNDKDWLSAEGQGTTVAEADRAALAELANAIVVQVASDFEIITEENDGDAHQYVTGRVKTYSQATLSNTERFILKNEPDAVVGRAIRRAEVSRIFESRRLKAVDMVQTALRAEEAGKADDALRNYYWAFALVRSLQHPNEAMFRDDNGQEHRMMVWIPERMNSVFDDLKVTAVGREGDDVDLAIAYKGRPVTSVDYTYFDGRDWSPINSAKDGRGVLELAAGNQSASYQLKFEYEYASEAQIDKEVEQVLQVVKSHALRKSYTKIDAPQAIQANTQKTSQAKDFTAAFASTKPFADTDESVVKAPEPLADAARYGRAMERVLQAVRTKNVASAADCFTADGLDLFRKLVFSYGTPRIVGTPSPTFYPIDNTVVARGVQMSFTFKSGVRKSFVEDMVFTFNAQGKIENVAFGLGKAAEQDILCKGVWSETARKVLMEFLENYKTAYALKRLDYIETIFDDDAVIIVANVAQRSGAAKADGGSTFMNDKIIKYNRYSKDQYLKNLARCFGSNEFINIRFANNDVMKLGKGGETYAIQISQDYYSSSYGDKGYLLLIVDVNDPKRPLIKVRTWQPEKDPKFGLYGPGDFK